MAGIFINYRREDAAADAGRLLDDLRRRYKDEHVFMDLTIEAGKDFRTALSEKLETCDVLLALMGPRWLHATNEATGKRRLDDEQDFVRLEIATALAQQKLVIPVILPGGKMPSPGSLPESIRELAWRNAFELHYKHWVSGVNELVQQFPDTLVKRTEMNWKRLRDICKDITEEQMKTVRGKHHKTELYLQRKHVREEFKTFLANSAQRGFVLLGKSGVGKSSFLLKFIEEVRKTKDLEEQTAKAQGHPAEEHEAVVQRGYDEQLFQILKEACVLMYDAAAIDLSSTKGITDIISEDLTDFAHLSGQKVKKVKRVWREIHKINRTQRKQFIFCVDAINGNKQPTKLLRQLNELLRWPWLKIVFTYRLETWRSIRVNLGPDIAEVKMLPFSPEELEKVYGKYQRAYNLKTPYKSLSERMRDILRDPLNLWLLAEAYGSEDVPESSRAIPETVKASDLIDLYVTALQERPLPEPILEGKDRLLLERDLVPLMVGMRHYSNVLTATDLYAAGLYYEVFPGKVSDGRPMNESFLRLADADILVQRNLGGEDTVQFKHERFYEHFVGKRIASLSKEQADRYTFFLELIEEIAGKKGAADGAKSTSKPFLWGAVRNALVEEAVEEAKNPNSETILKLCRTTEGRVKEMMVDVLVTLGWDFGEEVQGILKRLLPEEEEASELQKLRRVMSKGPKESEIVFRNTGTIAIGVASTLGITWVLQEASLREDPSLRTEAVRYSYYLWQRDRAAGFDVLEYVAEKATAGLIPNFRAFEFVFALSLIIFFEHHEDEAGSTACKIFGSG